MQSTLSGQPSCTMQTVCRDYADYYEWTAIMYSCVETVQSTLSGQPSCTPVWRLCRLLCTPVWSGLWVDSHRVLLCGDCAFYSEWTAIMYSCVETMHSTLSGQPSCTLCGQRLCRLLWVDSHHVLLCGETTAAIYSVCRDCAFYSEWTAIVYSCVETVQSTLSGQPSCTRVRTAYHVLLCVETMQTTLSGQPSCTPVWERLCILLWVDSHHVLLCGDYAFYSEWTAIMYSCV